ncbi:MAG: aldolase/citrate lyase family protein [Pelolinea sp.]|nr:aldolase/citrate lyase family protein [Pelolinea sp.]
MRQNPLRLKLEAGETIYGTMAQDSRSPSISLIMEQAGCDFMFFDMEHGPNDIGVVADMVKVARGTKVVPLVRVPDDQYHLMARILDAGAMGIMIPRIESKEQVERIIQNTHYPPLGVRGCSVTKGHNDFLPQNVWEFTEQSNKETMIILQIEREKAIENIDELLSVDGVDACVLGPVDLSLSMGVKDSDVQKALEPTIQIVLDSAKKHNVPCGIHIGNLEWLIEWDKRGMQMICYSNDIAFLKSGATTGISKLREAAEKNSN